MLERTIPELRPKLEKQQWPFFILRFKMELCNTNLQFFRKYKALSLLIDQRSNKICKNLKTKNKKYTVTKNPETPCWILFQVYLPHRFLDRFHLQQPLAKEPLIVNDFPRLPTWAEKSCKKAPDRILLYPLRQKRKGLRAKFFSHIASLLSLSLALSRGN